MTETREAQASWLHARFAPSSFDADARTIEVTWSTGASVRRRDWEGEFIEELDMSPEAVDLSRLAAGAPVLNSHDAWDLSSVLGVVERAWLADGAGHALLRFSEREAVAPIVADIRDGIIRNISVGYAVTQWQERKSKDGMRIKRATRWQPAEISMVPIPADASAQVRAAETPTGDGTDPTNPTQEARMADPAPVTPAAPPPVITPNLTETVDQARAAERTAERSRIAGLRQAANLGRGVVDAAVVDRLEQEAIAAGTTPEAFGARLFEASVTAGERVAAPTPRGATQMGNSGDDPAAILEALSTAMAVRVMPQIGRDATDQRFREFMNLRPSDMLMELAAARGERVGPRQRDALIARAFHTTSDFPMLLELAGNKMLEAGFALAAPTYRRFFGRKSFNDFRAHTFLSAGDFPALEVLGEGGEIKQGTISEKRERVTAKTYAKGISVTRQMLVNDDLGAFSDFGSMIGRRVSDYENSLAFALVNTASGAGPTLLEGSAAVFTTGRNTKAGTGAAITEASLDEGYAAIMGHTSLDGLKLNLQPRFLLTGPAYRGPAVRYTSRATTVVPESSANVGLYSDLVPIADANIAGNRWYMLADPAAAPIYVYGYVGGQEAPQIRVQQFVPGTDGILVEVVHDFAVGAVGFRGGWFNAGA